MTHAQTFMSEIVVSRSTAAKFFRTDFHLHSPFSHDWMEAANPLLKRNTALPIQDETVMAYYDTCLKAGVELAAITDHMRYSFGVACAKYSRNLTTAPKVTFLPGIELTVLLDIPTVKDYKIHILAIFPENASHAIERIFAGQTFPSEDQRNGKEALKIGHFKELVQLIHENGGLAIAAHIYGVNGARAMYTSTAKFILEPLEDNQSSDYKELYARVGDEVKKVLGCFDALQVKATTDPVHFVDSNGDLPLALVLGIDAHDTDRIGRLESLTWVKMAECSFEGLSKAFMFPDTRIRYKENLPKSKPPRLLGLRIQGTKKSERTYFNKLVLGFSDNLTTIIGPRGSGKSAIIDAIRYLFGYNRTLAEIDKLKEQIVERQRHTLIESRIELLYETKDGALRILSATYDPSEEYVTKVFDTEGKELQIEDVEQCGDFPLNLYGWNELELLGEQPHSQRENLDKFIHDLKLLKDQREDIYDELEKNRIECMLRVQKLEEFFLEGRGKISLLRLAEYEAEFNKLNTKEMSGKFETLDDLSVKLQWLSGLEDTAKAFKDSAGRLDIKEKLEFQGQVISPALKGWMNAYLADELKWGQFKDTAIEKRNELVAQAQTIAERISNKRETMLSTKRDLEQQIGSELGTETAITAELRNNAKARLNKAQSEYASYQETYRLFNESHDKRNDLVSKLREVNQKIFATRDKHKSTIVERIKVIQDEQFKIDLVLKQGNDRSDLVEHLTNSSFKPDYAGKQFKSQGLPLVMASKWNPLDLADVFLKNMTKELSGEIKKIGDDGSEKKQAIDQTTSVSIVNQNCPFQEIESPKITRITKDRLERVFKIQEVRYDDEFYITLNGKSIQHCSPGQRCSAMLPIVTLTSEAPIVIDQPEDNLDNRLVSKAIFKILAKLKESRQIIIATHNPNIPVSGDAEQVLVLDSEGSVKTFGSIDSDPIVQDIIDLLEGGKEAFERRRRKYQKHLDQEPLFGSAIRKS